MKKVAVILVAALTGFLLVSCKESEFSADNPKVPKSDNFVPLNRKIEVLQSQTLYVPVYSSIPHYMDSLTHLSAILSIRNVSPNDEIIISKVDYFDTNGKFLKSFIDKPFSLGKLSSKDFPIPVMDLSGGTGANFIVTWESEKKVVAPIIETIHIGKLGTQGFSFTSQAKEIQPEQ